MSRGFIHLDTLIVPQISRQYAQRYFSHPIKMFFPVQNNFPTERWEKSKFQRSLKELPNDFSIKCSGVKTLTIFSSVCKNKGKIYSKMN